MSFWERVRIYRDMERKHLVDAESEADRAYFEGMVDAYAVVLNEIRGVKEEEELG